ncbi:MAG: FliG C-terminal domain-containing protein [Bacteroidota bacterium]
MKLLATKIFLILTFASLLFADLESQKKIVETEIEARISTEIRKYYPELKFLLNADASITEELPAEDERDARDLMLPGVKGFESPKSLTKPTYVLDKIVVRLLVDKYGTKSDGELLRLLENIAFYAGKLNRTRGDRVELLEMAFPEVMSKLQQQMALQTVPPAEEKKSDEAKNEEKKEEPQQQPSIIYVDSSKQTAQEPMESASLFSPMNILFLILFLFLVVMVVMLMRKNKMDTMRFQQQLDDVSRRQEIKAPDPKEEIMMMLPENIQRANEVADSEKLKSNIVTTSVGRPDLLTAVVRDMMTDEQQKAKLQTALSQFGPSLLNMARENITQDDYKVLHQLVVEAPTKNVSETLEALTYFQNQLQIKQFTVSKKENQNPFAFLEKLSEPQLYLLMKDEPAGIVAIILSQLNASQSGSLMRNLPSMQQGEVALELAKLQRLTSDTYLSVARELATKASKIPAVNNVQMAGTDLLLDIFDNLDEGAEHQISEFIKVMNVDLYRDLASQRVSFAALDTLDERVLRQIMRDIPGEEMALALKNAPEHIRDRFLSVLPSKAKTILQEHMEGLESVSQADEQKIRRRITRLVREYLRLQKQGGPAA